MADIEINEELWDSVPDPDKAQILEQLKVHGLLRDADSIIGSAGIPYDSSESFLDDLKKPLCKLACDAAAAATTAALTLTGPGLAAAIVAIAVARNACRQRC